MCKYSNASLDEKFQFEKLEELKCKIGDELLKKTPLYNDENSLLRWLRAWNWDIGE